MNEVLSNWPLILIVEDCFCPEIAPLLLDLMLYIEDDLIDACRACDGYAAAIDALNRLN